MSGALPSIGRYHVEAEIGTGGFGAVYRAVHPVLGRKVALKVLHPQRAGDVEVMQRFLREARAVAQLGSPHIVQVLDADMTSDGRAFIAMELLEGEDLAARLKRTALLPGHLVIRIGREILAALKVAHAQGVVHRDLKPGNVFLAQTPGGEVTAKVLDFGISKVRTENPVDELTRTGTMLGTPHYMAPEQFRSSRDVDGRADLYSLGVVLYEALAGRLPYQGETLHALIAAKLTDPPPPLAQVAPHVPHAIAQVVMRALAPEVGQRYASADEMDAALAAVESTVSAPGVALGPARTSGRPAPMTSTPPATSVAPPAAGSRVLSWVLGIGGVVVFVSFVLLCLALLGAVVAEQQISAWLHGSDATTPAAAPPTPAPPLAPAPAPALAPAHAPALAPAPSATTTATGGAHVTARALGMVDQAVASALATRALPALPACRRATAYHEEIPVTVMAGGSLSPGGLTLEGATHDCVVDAIRAAGPASAATPGVIMFDVTLDPR